MSTSWQNKLMLLVLLLASACSTLPITVNPAPPVTVTPPVPPVTVTPPPAPPVIVTQLYAPSIENFANPERGFYQQESPLALLGERRPLNAASLATLGSAGVSTLRLYLMLDPFRDAAISSATLEYLGTQFDQVRASGLKVIPRFAYVYPQGGSFPYQIPDASLERVLSHIAQLEPLLRDNADIISFMETGFVGAWGEWHSSTNNLVGADAVNDNSRRIVTRLLEALPKSRMLALRYPKHKRQLFGETALTLSEAHSGIDRSRVGAYNDCFLASNTDWGTYSGDPLVREATKAYLQLDNLYVPQGGETCNSNAEAQSHIGCVNALKDLERMRFTALNRGYLRAVYDGWQSQGCLEAIKQRLGYRFELLESGLVEVAKAGQSVALTIKLSNKGFAAPFNPRGVALVLRDANGRLVLRQTLNDGLTTPSNRSFDPRFWLPAQTATLTTTLQLPANLELGQYQVLLHLYDPAPKLRDRPEYAMRLANAGVWEAQTGMNKLRVLEIKR